MKKIVMVSLLCELFVSFAFSQGVAQGHFVKRIENNYQSFLTLKNNLISKGSIEKLFFGDYNAPVEFSYLPSHEAAFKEQPLGFQIIMDSSNSSYILEVKYISNYKEAAKETSEEVKKEQHRLLIDLPAEVLNSLSREIFNQIWDYNNSISNGSSYHKRYFEELTKRFKVDTLSLPISNQLAEKLYEKMVSFIGNFKAIGTPAAIFDGYSVTFRTVVGDEVWSLNIHMPQGEALKMANLCRQIIADARTGKHDELRYIDVLDAF